MDEQSIIEGLKPICQCKGIKKKILLQHIASGIQTVEALKHISGAGSGSCEGKKCTPRIEALLASQANNSKPRLEQE